MSTIITETEAESSGTERVDMPRCEIKCKGNTGYSSHHELCFEDDSMELGFRRACSVVIQGERSGNGNAIDRHDNILKALDLCCNETRDAVLEFERACSELGMNNPYIIISENDVCSLSSGYLDTKANIGRVQLVPLSKIISRLIAKIDKLLTSD